jgi:abhydrolase domain-containing protein 6
MFDRGPSRLRLANACNIVPSARPAALLLISAERISMVDQATKTIAVGDKTLAYLEVGSGPTVVIVHGVGGHKEDWQGVALALSKSHHVFAIDMLGFGQSSKNGDDLSMLVQAAAIKALLDAHQIAKADLVGNSVGGWVATTFAATYPQSVDKLVIIDAAGFKAMFEGSPPVNFDPGNADEMQKLIDITINGPVAKTPGLAQRAYDRYVASGEKAITAIWGKSLFISPRLEELFPKVKAPTLVLWGADDKLFPSVLSGVFGAQIAGSTSQTIPAAGHFPQIDQPEATTAAIASFLN